MRLMVFFDLPVVSKEDRKQYNRFHRFLLNDGYDMIQFSVYARICNGQESVNKHLKRLSYNLPPKGSVRCMQVTEKQFTGILLLVGEKKKKEDPKYSQMVLDF
mgnify:CR=1 FL=1